MKLLSKFRTFLVTMPLRKKVWFVLMWPLTGLFRLAILVLPFRIYRGVLGKHVGKVEFCGLITESQFARAWQIGCAVELAARFTPWQSKCLVQALVGACWCRLYRIPYVVYLGVRKDDSGAMKAHAWLCTGKAIITGREGHQTFTIVSTFVPAFSGYSGTG